jgi:hypothetical protein
MSKHHTIHNVHLAGSSRTNHSGLLTLTALLLGGLAVPASAQNRPMARVAPERHFTIPADVPTPVVLMTEPDAACDLHAAGVNDPSRTMRLYGNIEGYVRFHFTPKQDTQDAHLQLDCRTQEAVTTHSVHLRIATSPTEDMPAPERSVPAPKGSKARPALTEEAAPQLSDEDITAQGYPPRPNTTESPEAYARWLDRVSRPATILPPHSVSRSGISHSPRNVTANLNTSVNWSGFVAQGGTGSYKAVYGTWVVPYVSGDPGLQEPCYSLVWVGLDGYTSNDLDQAGTEQDATDMFPFRTATNYYAWTEVIPHQSIQEIFNLNPGSTFSVVVYVGDSKGNIDPTGDYAWFNLVDVNSGQEFNTPTKLEKGFGFTGNSAEWIVERPCLGNCGSTSPIYPEFAEYSIVQITSASVLTGTKVIPYGTAENQQLTMRASYLPQPDNNVLSTVSSVTGSADSMKFLWKNFY